MAPPNAPSNLGSIQKMLELMGNADKDFRFMATNDLMSELNKAEQIRWDDEGEHKITKKIIALLQDKNCEVQNLAVKCLKYLVGKVKIDRVEYMVKVLATMMADNSEQVRDISSIALKTVVNEIPINDDTKRILSKDLVPRLLDLTKSEDHNIVLESLDILTEIINFIASQLNNEHPTIRNVLYHLLASSKCAYRKRSTNALSQLMIYCSDELFNDTMNNINASIVEIAPKSEEDAKLFLDPNNSRLEHAKTFLQCLASIIRASGHRALQEQITILLVPISNICKINDDELKEYCLLVYESFVRRCPVHVSQFLFDFIKISLLCISHDPNYNYDEDENEDEDMEMDSPEDGSSDSSEDYSDDDDISWKVRRASAKCLESIIVSRPDLINDFFVTIAQPLIFRFKEREENVKVDIIQTFIALLKQIRHVLSALPDLQSPPLALVKLGEFIPTIVNKSAYQLREKCVNTRQTIFSMYTEIMHIIPNAFSNSIASLVPGILYSLAVKNSTSSLKLSALAFVKDLMTTHSPETFYPHIQAVLPAITNLVNDTFYKIASECLALLAQIILILRPLDSPNVSPLKNYEPIVESIYKKILEQLNRTGADYEIKEKTIICLGQIIASFGDLMVSHLSEALILLSEKIENETTRLVAVKSLINITTSPIQVDLSPIFPKVYPSLAQFLRKNTRSLRINALVLIEASIHRMPNLIDESNIDLIFKETTPLIGESDLYISQLALNMITTSLKTQKAFLPILPQTILPETLQLIRSPLLQGSALQALLDFLSALIQTNFPGLDHKSLLMKLFEPIYKEISVHKQAYHSTAKAVAAISCFDVNCAVLTVGQLVNNYTQHQGNDSIQTLILLSIAEIGKTIDLSQVPGILNMILESFSSTTEDLKSAASYALGSIAVGNLAHFLPFIIKEIEVKNKKQYLLLHSLKEVITSGLADHLLVNEHLELIWALLINLSECSEEGPRNVVAECLGKLALLKPNLLLPRLLESLRITYKDSHLGRSTFITAIKFTISDQPHEIDKLLKEYLQQFLESLQDNDINVRRVTLVMLNSVAHNKPSLIRSFLPRLLPILYEETVVKQNLIRQVQMGPFEHKVDDGLDCRKAAFECMYTLLDSCPSQLDIFDFLTHVENGLKDHYDIRMLNYLMLARLAVLSPTATLQHMDRLLNPLEEVCRTKVKENAVKQEQERLDELKRSALRAFDALTAIQDASRYPSVIKFKHLISSDADLDNLYGCVRKDMNVTSGDTMRI